MFEKALAPVHPSINPSCTLRHPLVRVHLVERAQRRRGVQLRAAVQPKVLGVALQEALAQAAQQRLIEDGSGLGGHGCGVVCFTQYHPRYKLDGGAAHRGPAHHQGRYTTATTLAFPARPAHLQRLGALTPQVSAHQLRRHAHGQRSRIRTVATAVLLAAAFGGLQRGQAPDARQQRGQRLQQLGLGAGLGLPGGSRSGHVRNRETLHTLMQGEPALVQRQSIGPTHVISAACVRPHLLDAGALGQVQGRQGVALGNVALDVRQQQLRQQLVAARVGQEHLVCMGGHRNVWPWPLLST